MSAPTWQRVFSIFEQAVDLEPAEREGFLEGACETRRIRRMVEEMLAADAEDVTPSMRGPLADRSPAADALGGGPERQGSAEDSAPAPRMPETIGAYRILRRVGQGGMSTVYLAVRADDAFRRHVVVKVVRRGMETEPILRRLRTERQILASLDHPYVARLYDGGSTEEGLPYFVMEYVEGVAIDAYCEHNGLCVPERLALFRKVCSAVHYAHQNLVIHRDIKPSNILVNAAGDPKLLDFGIARLLNPDLISAEAEPTATWQRVMTPNYASPEQMRGQVVTTASDVYSLGVLLYKLLTGQLPRSFRGHSESEIERLLAETEPSPPSTCRGPGETTVHDWAKSVGKQLTGDLDAIVLKALRTAPGQRYGSVEQLDADLDRFQRGLPVEARAGTWRYKAGKLVRRHRTAAAGLAVAAVLLVGFAVAMAVQSARIARERDQARLERDKKQKVLELILEVFRFSNPYVLPGEELTVREALDRSVPVLEEGLEGQPEVRAELLHASGSILSLLGDARRAEDQLEEALELRRHLDGEASHEVVESMSALAAVRSALGRVDEAEALAREAVDLARTLDGGREAVLASALTGLVSILCHISQHEAAEAPAREALDLARKLPAAEQEAQALEFLAIIDTTRGEYASAEQLYREALMLRRARYGDRHPMLVNTLNNLALVLRRQEKLAAAQEAYEDLARLQRESFGEDFRDPYLLANLAGLRYAQGDYEAAVDLYGQALEVVREHLGEDHWMAYVVTLAGEDARIQRGGAEEAEGRIRRLLGTWRPRYEGHWRIAQGESVLGESLSVQGRCEEAEPLLTESYRVIAERARDRHRQDALERLRAHFERCGRPEEIAVYEAMGGVGT